MPKSGSSNRLPSAALSDILLKETDDGQITRRRQIYQGSKDPQATMQDSDMSFKLK